ncbi:ABC-three component system protein [Streptomyces sp. NPDC087420]|uniref:ABC-three component system protein n=1 Tax=Streptomyces sp. NPDC087420 TaxID=3365785 RepID=UPI0038395F58
MLRRLSANDPRFRRIDFSPGLNLLVADTTDVSGDKDSRNGTGKSSMVELLHFLLGARADKRSLPARKAVRKIAFSLDLDWPSADAGLLAVSRSGAHPEVVRLSQDIDADEPRRESLFDIDIAGPVEIPATRWTKLIEAELFGLRGEHPGLSGRTMLSFLIRRISSHAFNSPTRTYSQQSEADAATNLAYLLGLDWKLAGGYREISAREATRRQLRQAVNDPVWGRIVGSTAELRGQITIAEEEVRRLEEQIKTFRVVQQYEELKRRADEIDREIRTLNSQDSIDQRNLSDLRTAVRDTTDGDVRYLEPVYRELGILLGDQVKRRFDDVKDFHKSIIRNRQHYLAEEVESIENRLANRATQRERLGAELQQVLRTLNEGGALEALTALQQALAQKQASVGALRHRYEAAQTLEASALEIKAKRLDLQRALKDDLDERAMQTSEATVLFSEFAQRLYGSGRQAYLEFDAGPSSLRIVPHVDSDDSRGIGNMVIFCFDLTVAVVAHRHGRGPDFLVHDSHLFDGVDDRQLRDALELAAEVAEREGMQYIATLNSDDLEKAQRRGYDASGKVLPVRLDDEYDDGGLFGFRF